MPSYKVTIHRQRRTDKVMCYQDQPQWGRQHVDTEKLHMPVVLTRPIGCPYSYIRTDIRLFNIVYLHPTQIVEVSNSSSCTQLILEDRWTFSLHPHKGWTEEGVLH